MAVISHTGQMTSDGEGQGHYTCDVQAKDGHWYRTDDNEAPVQISERLLSKKCTVVLYSKIECWFQLIFSRELYHQYNII